jgi:hypothetical protein
MPDSLDIAIPGPRHCSEQLESFHRRVSFTVYNLVRAAFVLDRGRIPFGVGRLGAIVSKYFAGPFFFLFLIDYFLKKRRLGRRSFVIEMNYEYRSISRAGRQAGDDTVTNRVQIRTQNKTRGGG